VLSDCTSDERKWLSADVSLGIMLQLNKVCAMTQTGQMPIETVTKVRFYRSDVAVEGGRGLETHSIWCSDLVKAAA
jgi:hypothetical protein